MTIFQLESEPGSGRNRLPLTESCEEQLKDVRTWQMFETVRLRSKLSY